MLRATVADQNGLHLSPTVALVEHDRKHVVPLLFGRRREWTELVEALEAARGGFRAAVVSGPAGIGKTTIWEEAQRLTSTWSWTTLSARPAASEARLTYATLADLLAKAPSQVFAGVPALERRALEVVLLQAEAEGELGRRAVAAGLLAVLETLSRTGPVVIAVDDAQWIDAPSAEALEFAARRLDTQPIMLLLTLRTGGAPPFPLEQGCRRLTRIDLGPMRRDELHSLVRAEIDEPVSRRRLVELERFSGGNPSYALELVRAGHSESDAPPLPASVGDEFLARVRALPAAARDELLVVALADSPAQGLLDPRPTALLEEAGMIRAGDGGVVSVTHSLLAWAIMRSTSEDQRRAAHLRLVEHTWKEVDRARHRALAAARPSGPLAEELEQMAAAERARGAPSSAAELLSHARRLTPEDDHAAWARRCAHEAEMLLAAGDCEEAWTLGQEALDRLPRGSARADVLLRAADGRPAGRRLCLQALAEADEDQAVRVRAHVNVALQRLYRFSVAAAREQSELAVTLAREAGDPALLAFVLSFSGWIDFLCGAGDPLAGLDEAEELERTLPAGTKAGEPSARLWRAICLTFADEMEQARPAFEELLAEAIASGDESCEAKIRASLGVLELRAGHLGRAEEHLEASIRQGDLSENGLGRGVRRAWLGALQARRGEFHAAQATATEAIAIAASTGEQLTHLLGLATLAVAAINLDEPAEAVEHTDHIRRILPPGSDPPAWLEFEETEISALVSVGRIADAERRLESLLRRNRGEGRPRWRLCEAQAVSLLLSARGSLAPALLALDEALAGEDLAGVPFEHACTYLLKGQLERRRKRKAAARDALETAATLFDRIEAAGWAAKARGEMARLGLRQLKIGLTETEHRVALLAAAGKSNREIASALFISRRTVESNVARAYRKLGVRSRTELVHHVWLRDGLLG